MEEKVQTTEAGGELLVGLHEQESTERVGVKIHPFLIVNM